jgi:hypothetical protein
MKSVAVLLLVVALASAGAQVSARAVGSVGAANSGSNGVARCRWKVVVTPAVGDGELNAVAATSPSAAWAVGDINHYLPLVERWDDSSWKVVPSPRVRDGELKDVAAATADDAWAVGDINPPPPYSEPSRPLIEHWDGNRWSRVAIPAVRTPAQRRGCALGAQRLGRRGRWLPLRSRPSRTRCDSPLGRQDLDARF